MKQHFTCGFYSYDVENANLMILLAYILLGNIPRLEKATIKISCCFSRKIPLMRSGAAISAHPNRTVAHFTKNIDFIPKNPQ